MAFLMSDPLNKIWTGVGVFAQSGEGGGGEGHQNQSSGPATL